MGSITEQLETFAKDTVEDLALKIALAGIDAVVGFISKRIFRSTPVNDGAKQRIARAGLIAVAEQSKNELFMAMGGGEVMQETMNDAHHHAQLALDAFTPKPISERTIKPLDVDIKYETQAEHDAREARLTCPHCGAKPDVYGNRWHDAACTLGATDRPGDD